MDKAFFELNKHSKILFKCFFGPDQYILFIQKHINQSQTLQVISHILQLTHAA